MGGDRPGAEGRNTVPQLVGSPLSPCLKEGKADGAAMEPTDLPAVQAPAEPSLTQDTGIDWVLEGSQGPFFSGSSF